MRVNMDLLFVLLWTFIHLHTGACTWSVHVDQRSALLRSGDRYQVRCWATGGCGRDSHGAGAADQWSDRAAVTWSITEDRPMPADLRLTGGQEVTALFDPVTVQHEATYICRGRCGAQSKQLTTKIHVYSFPEDPVVWGHNLLEAGQEATLRCAVNHLYPGELATFHWLKAGGHAPLHSQSGEAVGGDDAVGSAYTFTPGREDAGSDITCRVTLDLEGVPDEERTRETTVTVTIKYPPEIVSVSEAVRVRMGSAVTLSCQATGSPEPLVHWSIVDTAGQSVPLVPPVRTPDLTLADVGVAQGGVYVCHASNLAGNRSANVTVTVLDPPEIVSVSEAVRVRMGSAVTLSCQAMGSPEPLVHWSFVDTAGRSVPLAPLARTPDLMLADVGVAQGGVYVCHASNLAGNRSANVTVTVLDPPEIVSISEAVRVRMGSAVTLSCQATGSPEPLVHWSFVDTAGQSIPLAPPARTPDLMLADVGVAQGGVYVCLASNLAGNRSANVTVTVLAPPVNTSLTVHPEEAVEGDIVTFTCQSLGSSSPEGWSLVLSRLIREEKEESQQIVEASDRSSSVSVTLPAVSAEDSGVYQCEALNQYGSQLVTKQLHVKAHPLKAVVLPATTTASEMGSDVLLSCRAMGCPHSAAVSWSRASRDGQTEIKTEGQVLASSDPSQRPEDLMASSLGPGGLLDLSLLGPVETRLGPADPVETRLGPGDPGSLGPGSVDLTLGLVDLSDGGVYVCQAQCGSVVRTNTITVHVFSFPSDPVITETQGAVLCCAVNHVYAANQLLRFQWLSGSRELGSEVKRLTNWNVSSGATDRNVSSELTYSPDERPGVVTCRVSLLTPGQEVWRVRESNFTLSVHSPPVNTSLTVHPEEVMEGHSVTFTCHSSGSSSPEGRSLVLRRVRGEESLQMKVSSSSSVSVTLSAVSMEDSGVYQCEAENLYGSTLVNKTLYVKAPPRNTTVEVLPSTVVQEGQNVTVCCRSVSFPPPAVVMLRKLANGTERRSADGTFLLVNVTANDTGLYQVNVTNELGFETEVFTISVMERTTRAPGGRLASVLIPSVSVLVGLLCSAAVLEHMRRAKKKGFYQLAKPASTAASADTSCDASSA